MAAILSAFLLLGDASRVVSAPPAQLKEFTVGDVFVAVSGGKVEWHTPDWTPFRILDTKITGISAGLAFNPATRGLYVTNNELNTVVFSDPAGNFLGRFGSNYKAQPTSILFDASGNVFVGQAGGQRLIKLRADGSPLASYDVAVDNQGYTWIDLAPDQCTMYYTTNGPSIKRFDVCANKQLLDFPATLPGTAYALRLLPAGRGLLVADSALILRYDMNGFLLQSYGRGGDTNWFGLSLDPDGKSFWSTDRGSNTVSKFDITSAAQPPLTFKIASNARVGGVAVFGEITVAQPTPAPTLTFTPTPTPTRTPTLSPTPTQFATPIPPPSLVPTRTPTLSPTPTQFPTPIPPPSLVPTRPPPLPTPAPRPTNGIPGILLLGGFAGGLASLVVIAVMAIAYARRPARPDIDRRDRAERAQSDMHARGHDDPGRQTVETQPHQPAPSIRFSLGQGEVNNVIETTDEKKPKEE